MTLHIAETRLRPPALVEKNLTRRRLITRIKNAVLKPGITLISAPAGSGKTTIMVQVLNELSDVPAAWLRLDKDDNEKGAFLNALIAACQVALVDQLPRTQTYSQSFFQNNFDKNILNCLINDCADLPYKKILIVLDDYHIISNNTIHRLMNDFINNLPAHINIVLISREDPPLSLAHWRVKGLLRTFRFEDLSFSSAEIQRYFKSLWNITLQTEERERILSNTSGWAASLHLLALHLHQHKESVQHLILQQAQWTTVRDMYSFLAEEVFNRQNEAMRWFLLSTSVLKTLTPTLCRAVTGNNRAGELLEKAYKNNLFLSPRAISHAYRYHDLFAEFLQNRLQHTHPGIINTLHIRTAAYCDDPVDKIHHYLNAGAWRETVEILQKAYAEILERGYIRQLKEWIATLPEALIGENPLMAYLYGICAMQLGEYVLAEEKYKLALRLYELQNNTDMQGEVLLKLANIGSALHDNQKTQHYFQLALTKPLKPFQQVQAYITTVWMNVYETHLNHPRLLEARNKALNIALSSMDPKALNILGFQLRAPLIFSKNGLQPIDRFCNVILSGEKHPASPSLIGSLALKNTILVFKGELDRARNLRKQALRLSKEMGRFPFITLELDLTELYDCLIRGDYKLFESCWESQYQHYEQSEGLRSWLPCFLFLKGAYLYIRNNPRELAEILIMITSGVKQDDLPENHLAIETLQGLHCILNHDPILAESHLNRALNIAQKAVHGLLFVNVYIWMAHFYYLNGQIQEATQIMQDFYNHFPMDALPAFSLKEGPVSGPLLQLINHSSARAASKIWQTYYQESTHPHILTPREHEVLAHIARGARNKEIADSLYISTRTVKAHVSQILSKLSARSRTQAVNRARQLDII